MIRRCENHEFDLILAIINDGARAYQGIIPDDCWTEPYMSREELREEIEAGVEFWGYDDQGNLSGVMGRQPLWDVTLIRHAYVQPGRQRQGIGTRLLCHLHELAKGPVLVGTWADAAWAIRFYEKHGFQMLRAQDKKQLIQRYWTVSERQMETSVVLADAVWLKLNQS